MSEKPQVHLSNRVDVLCTLLKNQLFAQGKDPFAKRWVFLPQTSLKNRLMIDLVQGDPNGVVMGVDFMELGRGLQALTHECLEETLIFPPLDLLALQLEPLLESPGLALPLAKEFLRYGKFGGIFLKRWEDPFQKPLWDQITRKWNYPYELLEKVLHPPKEPIEIHLFNFPFLPKLYHLFFEKLASYFPIHYYQFSPCKEFWSDHVSDREKMHLLEKDPQLSLYLEEGNHLLKNWGKMGRETFRVFEEEDFVLNEAYVEPASPLQRAILNDQKTPTEQDPSLLLIPAATKSREIEILFTKLLSLDYPPSEIQVFAPDIAPYAPLIESVFGADGSPFDFTLRDLPESPLIQTFYDLLTLNEKRFDPPSLLKLFGSPYFAFFNEKELKILKRWIDSSGVKWGVDHHHRKLLLEGHHDPSNQGTWEEAFDHLLNNLVFIPKTSSEWDLPYLDYSASELLGKMIVTIRSLRRDLETLASAQLTGKEWADHLLTLFEHYLAGEEQDVSPLQEKILLLRDLEGTFSLPSIKRYLANSLKQKKGVRHAHQLEAITFQSLKPGAILTSKVIVLLGMNEGVFPRPVTRSSLNLLKTQGDYSPTSPDEDRYLFLEALMAAKESLWMFYQNISEEDGKEHPPSLLVQELNPTIEEHPPFPFHADYFKTPKPLPERFFHAAETYYQKKKITPFIPEFLNPKPLHPSIAIDVPSLRDLARFAKHPLRYYCNHVLNLYLHYDDTTDPEFFLSPLHKHKLMQHETSLEEAEGRGHLPLGRFKEVAIQEILDEWKDVIPHVKGEGFPFLGVGKLEELVAVYPLYIIAFLEKPQPLIALKNGATFMFQGDPEKAYEDFLTYYQIALDTPSPFHSQLANAFLHKDASALASRLKSVAGSDPYLRKVFGDPNHFDVEALFKTWAPLLRKTFTPLMEMSHHATV